MGKAFIATVVALAAGAVSAHKCVHDTLLQKAPKAVRGSLNYPDLSGHGRRLTEATTAPLRITPLYVNITGDAVMTPDKQSFLQNQLIPTVQARWAQLLSVVPVSGPLYAHRECTSYWQTQTTPYKCAELDPVAVCAASPDDQYIPFDASYLGADQYYPSADGPATTLPAGAGLPNADFGIFITAIQTPSCGDGNSGVLAYALSCQRDQYDRPTWGRINFCPAALNTNPDAWAGQLGVALHEMAHALGFSSSSWPLFRDATGAPRTPRDERYPDVTAAAYIRQWSCSGRDTVRFMPAGTTVNYFTERGMACSLSGQGLNAPPYLPTSDCVAKMVTPNALAAARDFFGCDSLNGAELENQLTSDCDLQGSHWEQRILSTELMSSYTQHVMKVSALTLAVMEDSGWYKANYSAADPWRAGMDWGYKQGCAFAATSKCLNSNGVGTGTPPHFYSTTRAINGASSNAVCTPDSLAVGFAQVSTYSGSLPSQYQYFSGQARKGGAPPDTFDYCPAVQAYSNRLCRLSANQYQNAEVFGEVYGNTSWCFASTLRVSGYNTGGNGAGCYPATCTSANTVSITVVGTTSAYEVECTAGDGGQTVALPGFDGALTCPDPVIFCAGGSYITPNASANGMPSATPTPQPSPAGGAAASGIGAVAVTLVAGAALLSALRSLKD